MFHNISPVGPREKKVARPNGARHQDGMCRAARVLGATMICNTVPRVYVYVYVCVRVCVCVCAFVRVHAALSLAASVEEPSQVCVCMLRYHWRLASKSPRYYACACCAITGG